METPVNRQARVPLDIAVDLAASLDATEVVRRLLRRAIEALDADRGSVSWIEADELEIVDSQDPQATPLPVASRWKIALQSHTHRAVSTRAPVIGGAIDVSGLDGPMRDALVGVRHTISLPLELGGEVVAILAISRRRDVPFDDDDVAVLRTIGNVAVLALGNARLYAEAQEAARAKSAFLNMAAHELRTPLTVVAGYVSMLREGSLGIPDERWRRPLDILAAKCEELGELVENLLVTARLDSDVVPTASRRIDLRETALAALERAAPRAELLGAEMVHRLPDHAVAAAADPAHLDRILDNLVNNALTYVATGEPPWLCISVSDEDGPTLVVEDRGEGIPHAMRERIFERFVRVEEGQPRGRTGTGLGLAISREMAERNQGRLQLEWSEPGRGSRFRLTLPRG